MTLTPRETEVVDALARASVKDVAHRYGISIKTVEAHKANAMRKFDVHTLADLRSAMLRLELSEKGLAV